jgi:hypothetical protein
MYRPLDRVQVFDLFLELVGDLIVLVHLIVVEYLVPADEPHVLE